MAACPSAPVGGRGLDDDIAIEDDRVAAEAAQCGRQIAGAGRRAVQRVGAARLSWRMREIAANRTHVPRSAARSPAEGRNDAAGNALISRHR